MVVTPAPHARTRGFSLLELLVVVAIIAVVVALLVPALGGVRTAARRSSTETLMSNFMAAAMQFSQDNAGRMPGYFTPREMGDNQNATRGMSAMENAMLDLGGAEAVWTSDGAPPSDFIEVGPLSQGTVRVNPDLIGAGDNVYFSPPGEFWVAQTSDNGQQIGQPGHTAPDGDRQLPDLVDAWGNPLLLWSRDPNGPTIRDGLAAPTARERFARIDSAQAANFYWNSNRAFLAATSLGRSATNQTTAPGGGNRASLIGSGASDQDRVATMAAFLGNPSYPGTPTSGSALQGVNPDQIYPISPRGSFIVHSAGSDGYYLGSRDDGASSYGSDNRLSFGLQINNASGERWRDNDGSTRTLNLVDDFDDLIQSGGN